MTSRTLTTLATAGILAFGGMAVGAAPASAAICPPGQPCTVGKTTTYTTVGSVLRANKYGWPKDATLRYRWYRNGSYIAGGWDDTFTVRPWDKGAKINVRVHNTKADPMIFKVSRTYIAR